MLTAIADPPKAFDHDGYVQPAHNATVETPTTTDDDVPGQYKDIEVMTSPGALARILR